MRPARLFSSAVPWPVPAACSSRSAAYSSTPSQETQIVSTQHCFHTKLIMNLQNKTILHHYRIIIECCSLYINTENDIMKNNNYFEILRLTEIFQKSGNKHKAVREVEKQRRWNKYISRFSKLLVKELSKNALTDQNDNRDNKTYLGKGTPTQPLSRLSHSPGRTALSSISLKPIFSGWPISRPHFYPTLPLLSALSHLT